MKTTTKKMSILVLAALLDRHGAGVRTEANPARGPSA